MMIVELNNAGDCREQILASRRAGGNPEAVLISANSLPVPLASCVT